VGLGLQVDAQPGTQKSWQSVNGGSIYTPKVSWHASDSTYAGSSRPIYTQSAVISNAQSDTSKWYPIAGARAIALYYTSTVRAGAGADSTKLTWTFQTTPDTGLGTSFVKSIPRTHLTTSALTTELADSWVIYSQHADTTGYVQAGRWGRIIASQDLQVASGDTCDIDAILNILYEANPGPMGTAY
jgi:hypothetical protein